MTEPEEKESSAAGTVSSEESAGQLGTRTGGVQRKEKGQWSLSSSGLNWVHGPGASRE